MRRVGRLGDLTAADIDAGLERRQERQLARYERDLDTDTEAERLEYLDALEQDRDAAA